MSTRLALDQTLRIGAVMAAIFAAGCGGGGGGGTPPPVQPQLIQITAQNQDAVARATAATFYGMTGVRALPVTPSPSPQAVASGINDFAMRALGKAVAPARAPGAKVGRLAIHEETLGCTLGGSMTLRLNDADDNMIVTRGDVFTIVFNQCRESADELVNGTLQFDIASASETPTSLDMSGVFSFQQLTIVEAGYTSLLNGAMNTTYRESIDPMGTLTTQMTSSVTAGGMVGAASTPILSDTFTYDPGFTMESTDVEPATPTPPPFSTVALNGTVHVASLVGRSTIVTDPMTPIRDTWGAPYPESGQVTVLGKDSRLRLTVLNTERVRLELDANNDGTFEATKEMLWTDLLP